MAKHPHPNPLRWERGPELLDTSFLRGTLITLSPPPNASVERRDSYHALMSEAGHLPVMAEQVLGLLDPQPGMICLDCTVGRGGHATLVAPRLGPAGRLIGIDLDSANLEFVRDRLGGCLPALDLVHSDFREAHAALAELGVSQVDLILADLGFSSSQMDDPQRGFSFSHEGPLDMRLDRSRKLTAAELVNRLPEKQLANLIWEYGEERASRKIARKIVECRRQAPIDTTLQLAQIVRQACGRLRTSGPGRRNKPAGRPRIDVATRTFMALRIAVNDELEALRQFLGRMPQLLRPGGKAVLISFHSLEDRQVKQAFMALKRQRTAEWLTKGPLTADRGQRDGNPRSRSAKLRAIRMIAAVAPSDGSASPRRLT
jgi:16S rRNA (cytosine1402-N4)-methyltransferase